MDRIAAHGVRFELAYCAQPLCVPSRATMFSGRMPHEIGITHNGRRGPLEGPLLGSLLAKAGYDCGYVGKWHLPVDPNRTELHGFASIFTTNPPGQAVAHGFPEGEAAGRRPSDADIPGPCVEFLRRNRGRPFFLVASFVDPHDICEWARGQRLPHGEIPDPPEPAACPALPANFEIPAGEPPTLRAVQKLTPPTYPTIDWPPGRWRQYRWAYYRMVELVDRRIGEILDALSDAGLEERTVIIFSSDHGDGGGSHRWNQKSALYDEPSRVPFIVSLKGVTKAGGVDREHLVSSGLDLLPTICDYAGVSPPPGLLGMSVRPIAEGRNVESWREFVVVETEFPPKAGGEGLTGRALRSGRYKYIIYDRGDPREQLFDMVKDPGEMKSLVGLPAFETTLRQHRQRLARWCTETGDPFLVPGIQSDE